MRPEEQVAEEHDGRQKGEEHPQRDGQAAAVDLDPGSGIDRFVAVVGVSVSAVGTMSRT